VVVRRLHALKGRLWLQKVFAVQIQESNLDVRTYGAAFAEGEP